MNFIKMNGAGNDYVYVDCTKETLINPSETAKKVSNRHFGIGSDGLILIEASDRADFFMNMYNADGSRGKMCGNGIRCVGKFVYDNGLTDRTDITVDTLSGVKRLKLHIGGDGKVDAVTVDMGTPILMPEQIPVDVSAFQTKEQEGKPIIAGKLEVGGRIYEVTCVSMGNPHAVVYLDPNIDIKEFDIEAIGPLFETHPAFPERVNTEFVQVVDEHRLNMRVWERGSGETLACGTGACASLVASVLNKKCANEATLCLLGGDLHITWDRASDTVYMEGPAQTVYKGEIDL